jgi:hypothetical protein
VNTGFTLPSGIDHQAHSHNLRDTSAGTWDRIRDDLSPARRAVYEVLLDGEARTASEIGNADTTTGKCYWKRVSELVEMGLLRECAERQCRVTGQTCITYAIVPGAFPIGLPVVESPPPIPSKAEISAALEEIIYHVSEPSTALVKVGKWLRHRAKP